MTPKEREEQLIDEVSILPDAFERMSHLVDADKRRPGLPEEAKTDDRLVPGCQARVWIVRKVEGGRVHLSSDSDAPMVRALAGALCRVFSGSTQAEIEGHVPEFLERLQLLAQLTPTRQNGFQRMVERIKAPISEAPN